MRQIANGVKADPHADAYVYRYTYIKAKRHLIGDACGAAPALTINLSRAFLRGEIRFEASFRGFLYERAYGEC